VTRFVLADRGLRSASAKTWTAIEREPLGEWQLRASRGYTGRANSVLVLGEPGLSLVDAAARTVDFYRSRGLPVMAQIVIGSAEEQALRAIGWVEARPAEADCWVMTRPVGDEPVFALPVQLGDLTSEWLSARFPTGIPDGAWEVLGGGRRVFASVSTADGRVVGVGRGAVSTDYVGVSALAVDKAQRRNGSGTQMLRSLIGWGRDSGASIAFLEVLDDNVEARAAYRRLGFVDRYSYRYLTAPTS